MSTLKLPCLILCNLRIDFILKSPFKLGNNLENGMYDLMCNVNSNGRGNVSSCKLCPPGLLEDLVKLKKYKILGFDFTLTLRICFKSLKGHIVCTLPYHVMQQKSTALFWEN